MRVKKKAFLFFLFVAISVVAASSAVYLYFFLPKTLSSTETAERLASIYSRTNGILSLMSDDVKYLYNGTIGITTFTNRMQTKRNDMAALRTELLELKNVAHPSYEFSINFLDMGLKAYVKALDYAYNLNFNLTAEYLQRGTRYIDLSRDAQP